MTLVKRISPSHDPSKAECFGALEIKVARSAQDGRRAKTALGLEHGLGAGREAGDRLAQLVFQEGKLVAVLVCAPPPGICRPGTKPWAGMP